MAMTIKQAITHTVETPFWFFMDSSVNINTIITSNSNGNMINSNIDRELILY